MGQEGGHFSVVIWERLNSGKLIYFQLDPDPTYTGDIRSYFERTATRTDARQETLWNSAPGMTEWHRITVPRQAKRTLDCAPLTCLYTTVYVMIRHGKPNAFHGENDGFELKASSCDERSLGAWARQWMHKSIQNGRLQDSKMTERMLQLSATTRANKQSMVETANQKKRKRKKLRRHQNKV